MSYFNPRSPRGERPYSVFSWLESYNFNPRSPRGERLVKSADNLYSMIIFQSTLSARRATLKLIQLLTIFGFQSTLSARRATDYNPNHVSKNNMISIHALREESDTNAINKYKRFNIISIHALREESDLLRRWYAGDKSNFNPRSPRGERLILI